MARPWWVEEPYALMVSVQFCAGMTCVGRSHRVNRAKLIRYTRLYKDLPYFPILLAVGSALDWLRRWVY